MESMSSLQPSLSIFMKNAIQGKVKTRIAREVGDSVAMEIYNKLLLGMKSKISALSGIRVVVWYSDYEDEADRWPSHVLKRVQKGDTLGTRMNFAMSEEFRLGFTPVIVGVDIPDLSVQLVQDAFFGLQENDVVLGPAADGGYYLIGMHEHYPDLFQGIPWGTDSVLHDTRVKATQADLEIFELPTLRDVDTMEDVKAFALWSK